MAEASAERSGKIEEECPRKATGRRLKCTQIISLKVEHTKMWPVTFMMPRERLAEPEKGLKTSPQVAKVCEKTDYLLDNKTHIYRVLPCARACSNNSVV